MRYHYSSPYENDPDSPYDKSPDSPEAVADSDSPEDIPQEIQEVPEAPPQPTPPAGATGPRWRLLIAGGSLLVIVAIVLGFLVHAAASRSPITQASPTATPIPKVLYTADWSHGDAGWTLPSHWSLVNGHIANDGYGTQPLIIPYTVTQPNYTVSVGFTVQSVPPYRACHSYGIEGVGSGNTLQFLGDISCLTKLPVAYHGFSQNYVAHADSASTQMSTNDYTLQFYPQTFTVQVQDGHRVDFCPGVSCLSDVASTTPLSPLQIAIYDVALRLIVTSIVITTP
jgi:hypothetical protein